jgi:hypothetical protein
MARKSTGTEALAKAQVDLISATTIEQFQVAQAVVMPLVLGLTLAETASVMGRTPGWVARARINYIKRALEKKTPKPQGGRRNSLLTHDEEIDFVARANIHGNPWLKTAVALKKALDKHLGRKVAMSTAYKMIGRVEQARKQEIDAIPDK